MLREFPAVARPRSLPLRILSTMAGHRKSHGQSPTSEARRGSAARPETGNISRQEIQDIEERSSFGYSIGFLMVVLSRQQLFTETTITAVLPVMAELTFANVARMSRMWVIVLFANIAGTLFAAVFCSFAPVVSPELRESMLHISQHIIGPGWVEVFFRGISAGFLMAAMVWLLPSSDSAQFHVITMMTYLIAIGGFMHIVAGSMEAFLLLANGQLDAGSMILGFMAPVLAGNIVGGTVPFAVLSYAQVMNEI
jgi:formate/nitrite transporter FocA (FNT family)